MLCANEVYGKDALSPRTEARRSRKTKLISQGSVVHVSGGLPSPSEKMSTPTLSTLTSEALWSVDSPNFGHSVAMAGCHPETGQI